MLQQINREGKTIVVSSHQLGELEKICTRVIFIRHGELVAELSLKDYKESFFIEFMGSEEKAKNILRNSWKKWLVVLIMFVETIKVYYESFEICNKEQLSSMPLNGLLWAILIWHYTDGL